MQKIYSENNCLLTPLYTTENKKDSCLKETGSILNSCTSSKSIVQQRIASSNLEKALEECLD